MSTATLESHPQTEPVKRSRSRQRVLLLALPAVVLLGGLFVLPLIRLITDSFQTGNGFSFSRYADVMQDQVFWGVMVRTAGISLIVTLCAAIVGYPLAYAVVRMPKVLAAVVLACVSLPFFTSTLVRTYAWRALLADNGLINQWLIALGIFDKPHQLVFNDTGVIIGMSQVLLPMMILPIYAAMSGIDRSLSDAARSMGASRFSAWRTIFLPQSMAGVAAGASLVFISSLGYYTTPTLLGGASTPMIAQRIDVQINTQNAYGPTTAESALLLVLVVILMTVLRRPLGLTSPDADVVIGSSPSERWHKKHLTRLSAAVDHLVNVAGSGIIGKTGRRIGEMISSLRWVFISAMTVFGVVALIGPQVVITMLAFNDSNFLSFPPKEYSLRWFDEYFQDQYWLESTSLSLYVSLIAAVVSTAVGVLCAFTVARLKSRRASIAIYMLTLTPMVMPPIIYAVALFFLFAQTGILGTDLALILAYSVLGIPFVMITTQAVIRGIDPLYEKAAAALGANGLRRAFTILLPLIMPALVASLLFSFITAFDDLVMGVFLGDADTVTLQMRMYQDIQFEISPKIAAVGVLLTAGMLFAGILSLLLNKRKASATA